MEIHKNHLAPINSHFLKSSSQAHIGDLAQKEKKTGGQHETGMLGKGWGVLQGSGATEPIDSMKNRS